MSEWKFAPGDMIRQTDPHPVCGTGHAVVLEQVEHPDGRRSYRCVALWDPDAGPHYWSALGAERAYDIVELTP